MSIAEITKAASRLTPRQRAYLRAYLWMLERTETPEWKAEMAKRRRRMAAGHRLSERDVASIKRAVTKRSA